MKLHTIKGEDIGSEMMPTRILPRFYINEADLPEIASWELGGKYLLMIEVEMTGNRIDEHGDDAGSKEADLKVTKISSIDDVSDDHFEKMLAKAKSNG